MVVLLFGGKKLIFGTGASMRSFAWFSYGVRFVVCVFDGNVMLWFGDVLDVELVVSKMCGFKGSKIEDVLFLLINVMVVASSIGSLL